MYQPRIKDEQIRRLYKVRKEQKRPMTKVVAEAIEQYLANQEK